MRGRLIVLLPKIKQAAVVLVVLPPRVVCADAPGVAFGVFHGEIAAAVVGVVERSGDYGSGGYGAGMGGIGVGDDDIDASRFDAAKLIR
jgi:hypothetical protein